MVNKNTLLKKLEGTAPVSRVVTDDQSVKDIMNQMEVKHAACRSDYDKIYRTFEQGDLMQICEGLFDFCVDEITLKTDTEKKQFVSSPYTILKRGTSDCKCYALFIAGCLDAMKRAGMQVDWTYRFASYNFFDLDPHHVFVVVNPKTDNIWIDPVLGEFNYHYGYWYKKDRGPHKKKVGAIGRLGRMGSVLSATQSGGYYGKEVFDNEKLIPGAGDAYMQNPPVTYWWNGAQLILPNPNLTVGAAVPALPPGLEVRYAPSFMGYPIPGNMPRPVVAANNQLQIYPLELGATGADTNNLLTADNKVLLNVLMSAMGALVNAYSSRPYSNPQVNGPGTAGAFNALSHYILNDRNKSNFLDPIVEKTFAGQLISSVANTVLPVLTTVEATVANAVVPGSGKAVQAWGNFENSLLQGASNTNTSTTVNKTLAPQTLPAQTIIPGINNSFIYVAAAAVLLILLSDN